MERLGFVHLSGAREGEETWLPRLPAIVGSDPDADLQVPGAARRHAVVFGREGEVVLLDSGSPEGTFLAGQPVQEAVLHDGDVLELGRGGPRLRFERAGDPRRESAAGATPVSQTHVLRALAQSSRTFQRALLGVTVVALVIFAYMWRENRRVQGEVAALRELVGRADTERRAFEQRVALERGRADAERLALERRLEDYRTTEEDLRARLAVAAEGEVKSLKQELGATRERISTLETERAAGEQIIRQYGGGVCLVHGSFAFYDANERPLRYRARDEGAPHGTDGGLTTEGDGEIHTVEYFGTGFLVRSSLVLTNRHVAEPWWNDETADRLRGQGYHPKLAFLRAFFPRPGEAFELRLEKASATVDLAVLRTARPTRDIPVLPLEGTPGRTRAGQPVVLVGYPTGLEAILAKAESAVVRQILETHGTDSEKVTAVLAQKGLIRPSTTQGHIGDITRSDIVFDAPSAQGGSGGPVFNKYGQVIAVEYAVLQKFGGNSFGVPIAYATQLLRQVGTARRKGD